MLRTSYLDQIQKLDPVVDHCEIMRIMVGYEFPWDYRRSMIDMVFLRSLAAPRISRVVNGHGYVQAQAQKRYDDTAIMFTEFVKAGYASERGAWLIERMNEIHSRFTIREDDYLYVLAGLIVQPVRWNARFGWRPMCAKERLSNYYFWREVGLRMHLSNIPDSYEACEQLHDDYERENFRRTELSLKLSAVLIELIESWVPPLVRPLVRLGLSTLLEDDLLDCFGIPRPTPWMRSFASGAMRLRARALRFSPPRRHSAFFVDAPIRTYPHGYEITDLGPPANWQASHPPAL